MKKLQPISGVVEEYRKYFRCPNMGCDNHGSIAAGPDANGDYEQEQCQYCYERDDFVTQTLTQRDQAIKERLLEGVEGMKKIYDIRDKPHVALDDIKDIINQVIE